MSYILDALKRADVERERGHVPGLHAQPQPAPSVATGVGLPRWAVGAGAAVSLLLVAALAWRMGADTVAPVPATLAMPEPATAPPPTTTALAQPPAARPADEPVALAPVPAPPPATRPAPAAAKPSPASPQPAQPGRQEPAAAPINAHPNAANNAAASALPLYAQLPAALRQQLPTLVVTGSVYSEDAGARFVMLNGDVAKEGSQPAPGLVVERIEPKSAVLRFRGERFRLPY